MELTNIQKIKQVSGMLTQEAKKQHVYLRIKDFVLKSSSNDIVSIETEKDGIPALYKKYIAPL